MFNYARQRAADALGQSRTAVLATSGPAGVAVGEFPCEASGLVLYLLVPAGSDHLFNLEQNAQVSLLASGWALSGEARILGPGAGSLALALPRGPLAQGCQLVRVEPRRMHIRRESGWGTVETIDF